MTPQIQRRESTTALRFLATLVKGFTAVLDVRQLVEWTLIALRDDVGVASSAIALVEPQRPDVLTVVGATGLGRPSLGLELPRPHGIEWKVVTERRPSYIPADGSGGYRRRRPGPIGSAIYAPLVADGDALGTLAAFAGVPNAFAQDDLALLSIVAQYVANVVAIARLQERLRSLAATDPLTELSNRRHFLAELDRELTRARRTMVPLAVALLDLDGFKSLNDTRGHLAGDLALRQVGRTLRGRLRASDVLARLGGDEFAILLPDTGPDAPRLLRRLASAAVAVEPGGQRYPLTVSWGTASHPVDGDDAEALLRTADTRMYAMKRERKLLQVGSNWR